MRTAPVFAKPQDALSEMPRAKMLRAARYAAHSGIARILTASSANCTHNTLRPSTGWGAAEQASFCTL
jgi:hypothetical protein